MAENKSNAQLQIGSVYFQLLSGAIKLLENKLCLRSFSCFLESHELR